MRHSSDLNDLVMTLDELIDACGQERHWVMALIEENVIDVDGPGSQQFTGHQLATVRRASRLSRDFDASVPAIGLILQLLNEVEGLRQFKRQYNAHFQANEVIEVSWEG